MDKDIENQLNNLLSLKSENETVEFKQAKNSFDYDEIGKYFSALSNEANLKSIEDAWLVFGVNNEREIVGTNFRKDETSLQNLKNEIAKNTSGNISFKEIYTVKHPKGRVIIFNIPPAPNGFPISWKGHYYGRNYESISALNIEELERIRNQTKNKDWSSDICETANINDLDIEAINIARSNYIAKNPNLVEEIKGWDDITFLNKTKIFINGKPTKSAIILLGKTESEHFISPAITKISWILKNKDGEEKDYMHFSCPFIISVKEVYKKIRNLKYRYLPEGSLFPEEVEQYDPYIIREALNNCIAHQDYTMGGKINIVEYEDGSLIFSNSGTFIPKTIENVIGRDTPDEIYRNRLLATSMVNFNMIDTIGSGIKKMFNIQRAKFFPLPEYDFSNNKVQVQITGKVIDIKYARALAKMPGLTLNEIILLDKLQKNKPLNREEEKHLRKRNLIEGRKPNYYISSGVAQNTGQESDYIKQRGIDDQFCRKIILDYLTRFKTARRSTFESALIEKLPDILTLTQKKSKIKNNLQTLRRNGEISVSDNVWSLSKKLDEN